MKKILTFLSSLLILVGVKAQTPTIKKETLRPSSITPGLKPDSLAIKKNITIKKNDEAIKLDTVAKVTHKGLKTEHIKKTSSDTHIKRSITQPIKK